MDSEYLKAHRHGPIHQRGLFQVAESVIDVQRDPVMSGQHLPRSFRMDSVGIILQGRLGDTGEVDRRPHQHNQNDEELAFSGAGAGAVVSRDRNFQGRCGHERFIISG